MVFDDGVVQSDLVIVDDEASNVRLLEEALAQAGFTIIAGYTRPEDAWQRILRKPPDLMLLDLHMPTTDGFEMLRMLADGGRTRTSWPILVLTADSSPSSKFRALELGANDFLTKPFNLQEVFLRVNNLLAVHHLRGAIAAHTRQLEQRVAERTESLVMTVRALEEESKERRHAEHCLISQAQRLKAANVKAIESDRMKSELLATASHEMRTPLAVIREFSSLLLDGVVVSPAESREFLSAIVRNCDRLGGLLDNLLEMHRIETGHLSAKRRKTDIVNVLRRATTDLRAKGRSRNISVMLDARRHVPCVLADADKIEQVVVNLVGNAIKFGRDGGAVRVEAKANDSYVSVEVLDDGPGIAKPELARIFEAFCQVNRVEGPGMRGTGLGLTISKHIIEVHEGRIWVESESGRGAKFGFALPIWDPRAELRAFVFDQITSLGGIGELCFLVIVPFEATDSHHRDENVLATLGTLVSRALRAADDFLIAEHAGAVVCALATDPAGAEVALRRIQSLVAVSDIAAVPLRTTIVRSDAPDGPLDAISRICKGQGSTRPTSAADAQSSHFCRATRRVRMEKLGQ
jgi:signal transduction histidine kinase